MYFDNVVYIHTHIHTHTQTHTDTHKYFFIASHHIIFLRCIVFLFCFFNRTRFFAEHYFVTANFTFDLLDIKKSSVHRFILLDIGVKYCNNATLEEIPSRLLRYHFQKYPTDGPRTWNHNPSSHGRHWHGSIKKKIQRFAINWQICHNWSFETLYVQLLWIWFYDSFLTEQCTEQLVKLLWNSFVRNISFF